MPTLANLTNLTVLSRSGGAAAGWFGAVNVGVDQFTLGQAEFLGDGCKLLLGRHLDAQGDQLPARVGLHGFGARLDHGESLGRFDRYTRLPLRSLSTAIQRYA